MHLAHPGSRPPGCTLALITKLAPQISPSGLLYSKSVSLSKAGPETLLQQRTCFGRTPSSYHYCCWKRRPTLAGSVRVRRPTIFYLHSAFRVVFSIFALPQICWNHCPSACRAVSLIPASNIGTSSVCWNCHPSACRIVSWIFAPCTFNNYAKSVSGIIIRLPIEQWGWFSHFAPCTFDNYASSMPSESWIWISVRPLSIALLSRAPHIQPKP